MGQRLVEVELYTIVFLGTIDVLRVNGGGQHHDFALLFRGGHQFLELVKELKPIHQGHIDVQENDIGEHLVCNLQFFDVSQELNGTSGTGVNVDVLRNGGSFDHLLINEVVNLIVIDQHDGTVALGCHIHLGA